jgi:hypothetical protein
MYVVLKDRKFQFLKALNSVQSFTDETMKKPRSISKGVDLE